MMLILEIILALVIAFVLINSVGIYRAYFMAKRHEKIIEAIYAYRYYCMENNIDPEVDFDDRESLSKTVRRFYDWGYKNILPKGKYELIKEFI